LLNYVLKDASFTQYVEIAVNDLNPSE